MKTLVLALTLLVGFSACKNQRDIVSIDDSKSKPADSAPRIPKDKKIPDEIPKDQQKPEPKDEPKGDDELACTPDLNEWGNPGSCLCPTKTKYDGKLFACVLEEAPKNEEEKNELCSEEVDENGIPMTCACPSGMRFDREIFACVIDKEEPKEEEEADSCGVDETGTPKACVCGPGTRYDPKVYTCVPNELNPTVKKPAVIR